MRYAIFTPAHKPWVSELGQEFLKKWTDHFIKSVAAFPHKEELLKYGHFFDKLLIGLFKQ
jgi:hypothetical protein